MTPSVPPPPRLALCGNVFPSETSGAVFSALAGPVAEWAQALRGEGKASPPGFGLYLSARAAGEMAASSARKERLKEALGQAGVEVWTANAFPFGSFHDARVKERAFLPDWRSPERLLYSLQVAGILAFLMQPGSRGCLSTCPLGYGPDARRSPEARARLQTAQAELLSLEERTGVRLVLALEPEPDGAFERIVDLAVWLDKTLLSEVEPEERRIGICWDLCHAAVVGEHPGDVLAALAACRIPLGKIQISSALEADAPFSARAVERLGELARGPYLHQVRGSLPDGRPWAAGDLEAWWSAPRRPALDQIRIHCHVPLHRRDFGDGLTATPWRPAVRMALEAGFRDFEVETYTLPVLPPAFLERAGVAGTLVAEMESALLATGLRAAEPRS